MDTRIRLESEDYARVLSGVRTSAEFRQYVREKALNSKGKEAYLAIELSAPYADAQTLARLLASQDREKRLLLVVELSKFNAEQHRHLLSDALTDDDRGIRQRALVAFLKFGYPLRLRSGHFLDIPSGFSLNPKWAEWWSNSVKEPSWDERMQCVWVDD